MNKDRLIAVGILAGAIASIFATRTGTVATVVMWVFAGLAIAAFIALPGAWYQRNLSWLRSRVIARLVPRRLRRHRDQAQLRTAARWRFTTDGLEVPQASRDIDRNIDHPSYIRPADSVPPRMRIITLVPCSPLADAPDSQELRDRFLAWLAQTLAMPLIGDLRPGQENVSWKSWATPRRSNLRADLTGEDRAQVPVASAVLELPSNSVRLAGTDPRYAELILHVDLPVTDFARSLPNWRRRITQAMSMPGELARFLQELGLALPGEPSAQVGVLLRGKQSLTEIVSPGNIPALPATSAQIVSKFIGLAIAIPNGRTAEETAGQMMLDLSERDLHLNGSQAEMSGETCPVTDSVSSASDQPGRAGADRPLAAADGANQKIASTVRPVPLAKGTVSSSPRHTRPRVVMAGAASLMIAGLLIAVPVLTSGPARAPDPAHTPASWGCRWTYRASAGFTGTPAVAGSTVYFASADGTMHALNAASGHLLWTTGRSLMIPTSHHLVSNEISSRPALAGNSIYTSSWNHNVYALNAVSHRIIWTRSTGDPVISSPAVADGTVYIASKDGYVYALNASSGRIRWAQRTGGPVQSSPAIAGATVYIGSGDGKVYALNASTGHVRWAQPIGPFVLSSPLIAGGTLYVGSGDKAGDVYALDASTGHVRWARPTGQWIFFSSPVLADGIIYIGSTNGEVYAINAATSHTLWKQSIGKPTRRTPAVIHGSPAVSAGTVYIGSLLNDKVYALNARTGQIEATYLTGGAIVGSPVVADGTVYIGSDRIYALKTIKGTVSP